MDRTLFNGEEIGEVNMVPGTISPSQVVFPNDKKMAVHTRASPGLANARGQLGSGTLAV